MAVPPMTGPKGEVRHVAKIWSRIVRRRPMEILWLLVVAAVLFVPCCCVVKKGSLCYGAVSYIDTTHTTSTKIINLEMCT